MGNPDMVASAANDDLLTTGVNVDDLDNEDLDDDQDLDDDWDDWQQNWDQNNGQQGKKPNKVWHLHSIITNQNKVISSLKKDLEEIKAAKNNALSEEDLAAIRDKYDEDDLKVIEKIIERKTNSILSTKEANNLEQRETNLFVKNHPDLDDGDLRYIKTLSKEYWFSLEKAYNLHYWKGNIETKKQGIKVSWSFDGGSNAQKSNGKDTDSQAFKDMDKFL